MTKEEAIKILLRYDVNFYPHSASEKEQAIFMPIEALKSSERTAETAQNTSSSCAHENDLVFRKAAIEAVEKSMYENPHENEIHRGMHDHEHRHFLTILMGLPSAQPATNCSEIPNGSDDTISRQAAIDALARMMPRSYTPDGSHPADEEIFRAQEVFADCIEALEILPSAQPEQKTDEWIPISKETNPTKSGWYLVTVHEDATNDNERFTGMAEFNATNGMWYDIDEPTDMYLRWMPLPAPYRGGEKDDR